MRFSLFSIVSCLFLSNSTFAEDAPEISKYRELAGKLIVDTKAAKSTEEIENLKIQTKALMQAGVEIMKLYEQRNSLCSVQYAAFIAALPEMETLTLDELHKKYHNGEALPMAPRFCYLGRSQVIHPVLNLVRLKGELTEDVRAQLIADLEEVVEHMERIQKNISNPPKEPTYEKGKAALQSMTGCYLIDYSYTETEGLQPGYERDKRVYDVNVSKSHKEWIYADEISPNRIRIQPILFGTDMDGKVMDGSFLKHQSEDWEYNASFLYDFTAPGTWEVKELKGNPGMWTRKITNLDDGLRYQCAAAWNVASEYPNWSCDNYAPIPGRETRDMGRKDYNTLQRSTRLVAYGSSWLERQSNVKTIHKDGTKTPLAKELGKNWYVRLPESECAEAKKFVEPRRAFWNVLRETWDEVLVGDGKFVEKATQPPRFTKMFNLEANFRAQDLNNPAVRADAEKQIRNVIEEYRVK